MATGQDTQGWDQRRAAARLPANTKGRLTLRLPVGAVATINSRLVDVSETGLGFLHWAEIPVGAQVVLQRPWSDDAAIYSVVHCRPVPEGGFHVGAAFVRAIVCSDHDFAEALYDASNPADVERVRRASVA